MQCSLRNKSEVKEVLWRWGGEAEGKWRQRMERVRWREGGGERDGDAERDQDLYLSGLSEKGEPSWITGHSLRTIQFNTIWSQHSLQKPPPTLQTLNKTHRGENGRQEWRRTDRVHRRRAVRWRTNEVEICFPAQEREGGLQRGH